MHQQNFFFFGYSLLHEHANFPWNCRRWTVFYLSCIVASLNSMVILAEKGAYITLQDKKRVYIRIQKPLPFSRRKCLSLSRAKVNKG